MNWDFKLFSSLDYSTNKPISIVRYVEPVNHLKTSESAPKTSCSCGLKHRWNGVHLPSSNISEILPIYNILQNVSNLVP